VPAALALGLVAWAMAVTVAVAEDPPLWSGILELEAIAGASGGTHPDDGRQGADESYAEARLYWQPRLGIELGLGAGSESIEYHGAIHSGAAQGQWLRLPAMVMFSEHLGIVTLDSIGLASAPGVPEREARQWQIEGGLLLVRDENLYAALAAVITSRRGLRPSVIPLISLYWAIAPSWSLTLVDDLDNVSRLQRAFSAQWAASLVVDARIVEFALDRSAGAAAVLEDERAICGVEADWSPWGDAALIMRPFAGGVVYRRITLRSADGQRLASTRVAPVPCLSLTLVAEF